MSNILAADDNYKGFIENLNSSQKIVKTVNSELINLYYIIGKEIVEKQASAS